MASTTKYTDNTAQTFSTAVAILVTCASTGQTAEPKGPQFLACCGLVVASVLMYAKGPGDQGKNQFVKR